MSVQLTQDMQTTVEGLNLKWVVGGLETLKEITLIYFQNSGEDGDIHSLDVDPTLLKLNLQLELESGAQYSFQLQVLDTDEVMAFSNTLVITAPSFMVKPVITSIVGFDGGITVTLAPSSNLTFPNDTVEFVIKRTDTNAVFWVIKPINGTSYDIEGGQMINNKSYRVACMYQPSPGNPHYHSPSAMSNTMSAMPSNLPNLPSGLSMVSNGVSTLSLSASWTKPNDFAEWSMNPYSIKVKLLSASGLDERTVIINTDETNQVFNNLLQGTSYAFSIQYVNTYGSGPIAQSSFYAPKRVPDSPTIVSVSPSDGGATITWLPPSYDGNSAVLNYTVWYGMSFVTVSGNTGDPSFSTTINGLTNGFTYSFKIYAINDVGPSEVSSSLSTIPYGNMSFTSVIPTGKTLQINMSPNGRAIQKVVVVALDEDPVAGESASFVYEFTQGQISQSLTGTVTLSRTFSAFSSNIQFYAVIANNVAETVFTRS